MNWPYSILMEGESGLDGGNGNGGGGWSPDGAELGGQPAEQQQQAFTPSYEGALGSDGRFADGWTAKAFGPEYGDGPLARVKTVADLDKAFRYNMAAARGKVPTAPTEKSTPEEVAAWRRMLGAPERPEAYGDLRPETIPAELWNTESEARLQTIAHKHHLPPSALKDVVGLYADSLGEAVKQNEAAMQSHWAAEMNTLRAEFGKDFEPSMHAAKQMAVRLGLSVDDPAFNSAKVVIAMAKASKLVGEDKLVNGHTPGLGGTPNRQAEAIMTDRSNPLYAKYQEGDKDTVSLVNNLLMQGV